MVRQIICAAPDIFIAQPQGKRSPRILMTKSTFKHCGKLAVLSRRCYGQGQSLNLKARFKALSWLNRTVTLVSIAIFVAFLRVGLNLMVCCN